MFSKKTIMRKAAVFLPAIAIMFLGVSQVTSAQAASVKNLPLETDISFALSTGFNRKINEINLPGQHLGNSSNSYSLPDNYFSLNAGLKFYGYISAVVVSQEGDVYVGGNFTLLGNNVSHNIAKWDGTTWSALGDGLNGPVRDIAIAKSGVVYAVGDFTRAGGDINADSIARWDGTSWSAVGNGLYPGGKPNGTGGTIHALAINDLDEVYVCGDFANAMNWSVLGIAKWNGTTWSGFPNAYFSNCLAIAVKGTDEVYVGGIFNFDNGINNIAKWNGTSWSALGMGLSSTVGAIAISKTGEVYAGGYFTDAGGNANADRIAKWNGTTWLPLGTGLNDFVGTIAISDSGDVYAGGSFTDAGGNANADYIAKWDGTNWSPLGNELLTTTLDIDISGANVYAGFLMNGETNSVVEAGQWNGVTWLGVDSSPLSRYDWLVTKYADTNDGVCDADCSLREAIAAASTGDKIKIEPSVNIIFLVSPLVIDKSLTIDGPDVLNPSAYIRGGIGFEGIGDVSSLFQVGESTVVELNGFNIQNGNGSGLDGGGGIANYGTLIVRNSDLSHNHYTGGLGGGGIYNGGTLTLVNSMLYDNSAEDGGGVFNDYGRILTIINSTFHSNNAQSENALLGNGGGIANVGVLFVENSTFFRNHAYNGGGAIVNSINGSSIIKNSSFTENSSFGNGYGGAIGNYEGDVAIEYTTFTSNSDIGGMANYGGGVYNADQMSISDSAFTYNSSDRHGGGIANLGSLTVTNSILQGNSADYGGGIANFGILMVGNSNIFANSASSGYGAGGGIINDGNGILTVSNSTVSYNSAPNGGGIFNLSFTSTANISTSTISTNSATDNGGGISNWGTLTAVNSTFFGNSAAYGGGIFSLGTLTTINNTISGNSASTNGGGIANFGTLNYANTIIANSATGADCYSEGGVIGINTNNLVENNSASPNQCGVPSLVSDPNLGSLAINGGPTQTMALLPGSPAIDMGDDSICAAAPVSNMSQNGVARPVGAHCDIGSFEYVDISPPVVFKVTRIHPNPTAAGNVGFSVQFSEPVTGVDTITPFDDFALTATGVTGALITGVVPESATTYNVTVNTGSGNGTIRLDVKTGGNIVDNDLNPLSSSYTSGEVYTITKTNSLLVTPANNGSISSATPTFTWKTVTGALEYQLQVAETDWFIASEVDHSQPSGTSYISPALDYGVHYWRMRVRTASGWGPWTPAWKFTLTPTSPTAPILASPANAAVLSDNTPLLAWNMGLEDDRYELQIDNLSTFASPEQSFSVGTGVLTYTATTLPDGIWYWRVRAINYLNIPSAWSAYRSFTVDTTGPIAPVLSAPANAASVIGTPAFSWAAAATATKYQLEYDNDADFSSPTYTSIDLTTTSHTPPAMAFGTYSWHVRGKDAAGNWGAWSTTRTVTILPAVPVAPVLVNPAASAVTSDSTPDFTWNNVVSGNTYQLEISNASTFATKQQTFAGGVGVLTYAATTIPDGLWYWHVRALNVNGVAGAWSAYRSFTVDTTGPVAPVLSAPANAASVIGTPAFSWAAAATATKYQFEYDNDADFSSPIYTSVDITTTSHTPPVMALGTYSWHVRGKDAAGNWGAWSTARTVTILPAVPVAPVLVNPAASAVTNDPTPDFTWNSVVSGNTYQLEISNASTFAIKQQTFTGGVGVLTYTATNIPDGVWYWHVRALNVNGVAGAWSAYRSFTMDMTGPVAPVLSAPANAALVIGTPAFSWAAAATATKYKFEYDNDADFSSPTYTSIDLTTTSHTPPAMALGTYSWRVRGKDAAGNWGAWSATRTVTILPLVPVAPVLVNPTASAVMNDVTPDFAWNSVVSGNIYELEISNASTFATKQQTFAGGVGVLNYTATTIPDGVWYWHVRALNVNGVAGVWSAYRSFTVDTTGPVAPVLSAPANAASVIGTPAFSWAAAATATKYQFEYDNDADFSSPIYTSIDLTTTSHTPPAMALGTYSWHVRGKDAAGNWGAWSTARTVTILPLVPVAPILATPAASAVTNDSTPDFAWNSVVSGNTYELEISNASTFATKQQTFSGGVGVLNYTATNIPDGVWYWHVRALNVNGVAGAWSAYRSFTVDTTGPVAPTLSAPANAASVIGTPAFSWAAAATATKYQFEYDNDSDFSSPIYTSIDLTTTSHIPPAIALGTYSWHVRGKDAAGNWGAWSTARTVTILPAVPVAPVLVNPAASAITSDSTPDFSWNSVVSGNTYQLEISNASTFATKQQTFAGGVGVLIYTATNIPDGVWYWHVRALNVNSVAGAWSAYRSFTVDTTGPVAPTLSAPANAASVIGRPAFSWAAATTATKYQFEYDNDADFSSPTYTSIDLTTTSHTPPAIALGAYSWHVRGKDAAGNWGAWSTARTVTILPAVPVAPVLVNPAASVVTSDSTPDFTWNSVVSGNTYELEISNASTFATKQQTFAGGVGVLNYTATNIPDGMWYWHVRALNMNGVAGAWSAYRSFTVDTAGPVAPVLSAPANVASVNGTPAFSWVAASTATKYQFEYDNDADFSSPIYTSADLTTTSYTPPAMAIGTYSWHVRGKDAAGNWGAWSTTRTVSIIPLVPATPTLTSPANGSISQNPAPALNWTAMPNAASYQVQMDKNSTFSSPEFDGNSATNTITPTSLVDGIYYWRVRQTNILGGTSLWSAAWRVTISQPIPAAPNGNSLRTLELPTSDTGLPTFNWSSVEYGMTYQLQVADNETFTDLIFDDTADTTERTLTEPLAIGEYFWRVRAINEYGTAGPWSETWTITVDIPPAAPTLLLPSRATVSLNGEASFSWQDAENAKKYQIQVDDAEDFSSPEFDDAATQITRELVTALTDGTYFWRVRGLNIYDTVGEWSEVRSFTVSIPLTAPTLLTPEVDSTDETGLPAFEWEAVLNGATYQIQVDNNADFSSPEFDDTAETITRELATPLENGIYYWRVRAIKADDTFGEWSLVWSFTVNIP